MTTLGDWLRGIGLGEHERVFAENDVDLEILKDLTESDLASLGLSLGHRKRLLRAIQDRDSQRSADVADAGAVTATPVAMAEPSSHGAERRHITVMFCDLVDSTRLANHVDAEDLRAILSRYQATCTTEISRLGGQVARTFGDGILAYFGFPKAHEDDAERAVRAGFGIVDEVGKISIPGSEPLQVRVGLATGPAVVEDMVDGGWTAETATGRTLNLAARIQSFATPGTIFADEHTVRRVGRTFHPVELGAFELRGFEVPVRLWRVDQPVELFSRFEALHDHEFTPLVGRREELAALLARSRDALTHRGHAVLICADPGVGKSRLLHELHVALGESKFVVGQCLSYGGDTPYLPLLGLLKKLLGIREQDRPEKKRLAIATVLASVRCRASAGPFLAHLLDASEPDDEVYHLPGQVRQAKTFAAITDFIIALARATPFVLAVEDLHWIDRTSEAFLTSLIDHIEDVPVLFVATHRPEYQAPWSRRHMVTHVVLSPLDREDSLGLISAVLGERASDPSIASLVTEKAQGNPLFLEELSRAIAENAAGVGLPDTVQGVLICRIDSLPRASRNALQTAAVLGREFRLRVLDAVWASTARLTDLLADLERLQLIYQRIEADETVLVFRHALIQDAAYEMLLVARRQELHRQVAQAIERLFPDASTEMAPMLAHHYVRAKDAANGVKYLLLLADRSLSAYALKEAESTLRQVLVLTDQLGEPERTRQRLNAVYRLSQTLYFLGRFQESVDVIESERAYLDLADDPAVTAPCLFWLSHMLIRLARYDDAEQAAMRSIEQATPRGDNLTLGKALGARCLHACLVGAMTTAADTGRRSIELLRQTNEPYWLGMSEFYLAMVSITLGEFAAAAECSARALEVGQRIADPRLQAYALFVRGWALADAGDADAGIEAAISATKLAPDPTSRVYSAGFLAYAYLEAGDMRRALPALEAAREEISRIGFRPFEGLFLAYLSEAQRRTGSASVALATADRAIEAALQFRYPLGQGWAQRARGRALAAVERDVEARSALDAAIGIFKALGAHHEVARTEAGRTALTMTPSQGISRATDNPCSTMRRNVGS